MVNAFVIAGTVVSAIAIIFFIVALIIGLVRMNSLNKCTYKTYAVVTRMLTQDFNAHSFDDPSQYMFTPELRYVANGYEMLSHSHIYRTNWNFKVGDTIPILYDPGNPKHFIFVGSKLSKILVIVFSAVGGLLMILGLSLIFMGV